jgi:hypothetical protein
MTTDPAVVGVIAGGFAADPFVPEAVVCVTLNGVVACAPRQT